MKSSSMPSHLHAKRALFFLTLSVLLISRAIPQTPSIRPPNYDESQVPKYTLTQPLQRPDGRPVTSPEDWSKQRKHLVHLFAEHEYGFAPTEPIVLTVETLDDGTYVTPNDEDPSIRRRQLAVTLTRNDRSVRIDLLLWSPARADQKVGCFLGLNFHGNHATSDDPNVRITSSWCDARHLGVVDNRATEASRGSQKDRWPIQDIVHAGYAVATAHYCDIDPDFDDQFENGVHALYPEFRCSDDHPNRWGSIAAWAWGLSRLADVLSRTDGIDAERLMVIGHSRLGKTALWAGATDERFRLVISNNSGCGGAALSKRCVGESVAAINRTFPHWFNRNFRHYNDAEENLPMDQHQLIASIAPRLVYIASASEDRWADPLGELLAGHHASPAYALFGHQGLPATQLPEMNTSIGDAIGYHVRDGKHDITPLDWKLFVEFAKRNGL